MTVLTALLVGLSAAFALAGGQGLFVSQRAKDRKWLTEAVHRFTPKDVPLDKWSTAYTVSRFLVFPILLLLLGNIVLAIGLWVLLLVLPNQVVHVLWSRRRREIDAQLPIVISSMASNISAGLTLVQSIQRLAERAPEPARTEFRIMSNRYALGQNLESLIGEAKERLNLPNFNLFASALLINREMGGDVGVALDRISKSIEKLNQMRQTVKASTSEGRTNIRVLMLAPFAILLLLYTIDPEGVLLLFQTMWGVLILMVAALLTGAGLFWASKIIGQEI